MQSLTASTPCKPRNGFAFHSSLSICESFVNYCNLLLQFTRNKFRKTSEKVLTNGRQSDIITKLSERATSSVEGWKKLEKSFAKPLDKAAAK